MLAEVVVLTLLARGVADAIDAVDGEATLGPDNGHESIAVEAGSASVGALLTRSLGRGHSC